MAKVKIKDYEENANVLRRDKGEKAMRPIYADVLLESIGIAPDICCPKCKHSNDCRKNIMYTRNDICQMVNDIPTVSDWISVKDGLPERYERILTYDKHSGVKENWLLQSDPCVSWSYGFHVTHWMPMPEPPKEDKNYDN